MLVIFTRHARQRCKQRNLNMDEMRSVIKKVPPCFDIMRFEVETDLIAVFHDVNGIRYVVTVYRKDERYEQHRTNARPRRQPWKGRRWNNRMGDF